MAARGLDGLPLSASLRQAVNLVGQGFVRQFTLIPRSRAAALLARRQTATTTQAR